MCVPDQRAWISPSHALPTMYPLANHLSAQRSCLRRSGTASTTGSNFGQPIIVRLPQETLEGRFYGLAPNGALQLEQADGAILDVTAGDVFFG